MDKKDIFIKPPLNLLRSNRDKSATHIRTEMIYTEMHWYGLSWVGCLTLCNEMVLSSHLLSAWKWMWSCNRCKKKRPWEKWANKQYHQHKIKYKIHKIITVMALINDFQIKLLLCMRARARSDPVGRRAKVQYATAVFLAFLVLLFSLRNIII